MSVQAELALELPEVVSVDNAGLCQNWPHSLWALVWWPNHVVDDETAAAFLAATRDFKLVLVDWEQERIVVWSYFMSEKPLRSDVFPLSDLLRVMTEYLAAGYRGRELPHQISDAKGRKNQVHRVMAGYADGDEHTPYERAPYTLEQIGQFYPTWEPPDLATYHEGVDASHRDAMRRAAAS